MTMSRIERNQRKMPLEPKATGFALEVLLSEIVLVLSRAGLNSKRLLSALRKSARSLRTNEVAQIDRRFAAVRGWYEQVVDMSEVVADWHRNAQYTDAKGDPLPLRREALETLIAARCGVSRCSQIFASMRKNGIVQLNRRRQYELRSRRAVLFDGPQLALVRAAVVVPEVLAVALQNGYASNPEQRDIHRTVRVRHLPRKYLSLWRQLIKERSEDFLEGLDNWLEDHNEPHAAEPTVTVAAHVCAYIGKRPRSAVPRRAARHRGSGAVKEPQRAGAAASVDLHRDAPID
jgi:hypothetical protein